MWMQVDDTQAAALLAVAAQEPAVAYFQERVRHYQGLASPVEARFRAAAQEAAREGELEVDDDATVSLGSDPGAYVQAWKWISNEEAGFEDDETGSEELEIAGAENHDEN